MTALLRHAPAPRPRGAEPGTGPQLRALDRPLRIRRPPRDRRLLLLVGGGLLFAAVLGGNVAVQAQTTQGQFELERLQASARQRQAHYQQLRLEVAELEAPQRIVDRAHQLGMVEPASVTYLTPTAKTSASGPAPGIDAAPDDQAAQGWSDVKPHLDRDR
jgi:cell division protein FtsL